MTKYPKRLIEVDLPIKRISAHARREKSIRHGHISTLHIWWARRPLAACRAVICASLWPDPADPLCPQVFRDKASKIISDFAQAAVNQKELGESCDHETWIKWQVLAKTGGLDSRKEAHWNILRFALLDFIADCANWDNSTVKEYLETSRALTQAAHEALGGEPGTRPLVVDPFAGGGSIPLEALRAGADAFASDLNPIPVLLNKVVLEYIPKYGQRLADEVRKWGEWIKLEAQKDLAKFYPVRRVLPDELQKRPLLLINAKSGGFGYVTVTDAQRHLDENGGEYTHYVPITTGQAHGPTALSAAFGEIARIGRSPEQRIKELGAVPLNFIEEVPIAYLWARTIRCEGPACGLILPLIRTDEVDERAQLRFKLAASDERIEATIVKSVESLETTVKAGSATCPKCHHTTPAGRVRAQLASKHGGAEDAQLLAVIARTRDGITYRPPNLTDLNAVRNSIVRSPKEDMGRITEIRPAPNTRGVSAVTSIGIKDFRDVFSPRQRLALCSISSAISKLWEMRKDCFDDEGLATAVSSVLALVSGRLADYSSTLCTWVSDGGFVGHTFTKHALPNVWDFAEVNPISDGGGSFESAMGWVLRVIEANNAADYLSGTVIQADARIASLPQGAADLACTDPPYYAEIPYADISDFFYVWLRKSMQSIDPQLFTSLQVQRENEIIVTNSYKEIKKDAQYFEEGISLAASALVLSTKPSGLLVFVFANAKTAAWEAMLQALINAGLSVVASWPIETERAARSRAQRSASLLSSVHIVCRPRSAVSNSVDFDSVGEWRTVLTELPHRIKEWMPRLQGEGVVGADAIFACLGPALEVFSRYSRVEKASGEVVELKEYLVQVWAAVAKEALAQVFKGADATGFEPDARLTAMWLWTLKAPEANGNADESEDDEDDSSEEQDGNKTKAGGFKMVYDAARKIAQGLGAELDSLPHLVEVKGNQARLLPVSERTKHLFGKDEEEAARATGRKKSAAQMDLFATLTGSEDTEVAWKEKTVKRIGETALDRVHQAMILFAAGRGEALKRFVVEDGVGQDGKFWRLAQALSALYPSGTDEKRWVDGVLARKKQFGF